MTRDEILTMEAGREMDKLVARVMGWSPEQICDGDIGELPDSAAGWFCLECDYVGAWGDSFEHFRQPLRYSTDIAAAWTLVDWLLEHGYDIDIYNHDGTGMNWNVLIDFGECGTAPSVCLAICRAALLAVVAGG